MIIAKSKLLERSLAVFIFVGAVAFGIGSAQGQSPATGGFLGGATGMPAMPSSLPNGGSSTTIGATVAPAANPPESKGPLVVSGPSTAPAPTPLTSAPTTGGALAASINNSQGPGAASQPNFQSPPKDLPKPTATPFVASQVEAFVVPKSGHSPTAILRTSMGDITIRLFKNEAPRTVQNFLDLARGDREFLDAKTSKKVLRPFYTGLIFHRVIKDFVIQTGCPFGTGRGDPGYNLPDEISTNLKHDKPGIVSMALAQDSKAGYEKNSNGSQFFITLSPQPAFDGKFTIFGEVVSGMDVAQRIGSVRTGPTDRPIKKVYLLSIDVNEPPKIPMPASLGVPSSSISPATTPPLPFNMRNNLIPAK